MVKVYDCFTFFNEFDILRVRLNELSDVVDRFVIVESTKTFTGNPKPLYFAERYREFSDLAHKIIHVVVGDMPSDDDHWRREAHQRNAIVRGLNDMVSEDIVMISDADEIPRRDVVANMREQPHDFFLLKLPTFYIKFNNVNIAGHPHVVWPVALRGGRLTVPEDVRRTRWHIDQMPFRGSQPVRGLSYDHAGWHFSYLGDQNAIKEKIRSFSHQEVNNEHVLGNIDLDRMLKTGEDLLGRRDFEWSPVALNDYFPDFIRQNMDAFRDHILFDCDMIIDRNIGGGGIRLLPAK